MMNTRQMLVVVPRNGVSLSDDALFSFAQNLLEVADAPTQSAWDKTKDVGLKTMRQVLPRSIAGGPAENAYRALQNNHPWDKLSAENRASALALSRPVVLQIFRRLFRDRQSLEAALPNLSIYDEGDQALEAFSCSTKRFITNVVYVAHPVLSRRFIRMSDYQTESLNDKRAAFVTLCAKLGARSIQLVESTAKKKEGTASVGLSDAVEEGNAGVSGHAGGSKQTNFAINATFNDRPTALPCLPEEMPWLETETMWAVMAERRLEDWATSFDVDFSFQNSLDMGANFSALIEGLGFSTGGEFSKVESFSHRYQVEFWPRSAYEGLEVKTPIEA